KQLEARHKQSVADLQLAILRQYDPEQSEANRQATLAALKIADNNRSQTQRILVEKLQQAELDLRVQESQPVLAAQMKLAQLESEMLDVERAMEPPLEIRALWDRGDPSPTYVLRRGEHDKPGSLVGPGVPSVLTDVQTPWQYTAPFPGKTGRRLALARWLTRPDHPLTARVMVNRIWFHHFGRGLVGTLENFGVQGARPSHPELLDWLAVEFTESGWSIKHMHRLIMNSQTYRQSSHSGKEQAERDPQNQLWSRMQLRRLDAEALRDSLPSVSGRLEDTPGGAPDRVVVDRDGLVSVQPTANGNWRRSVYLQFRRTEIPTMMDAFDYPEMGPNCLTRNVSIVSPQALLMMNNEHIYTLAGGLADRVLTLHDEPCDPGLLVDAVYDIALSRMPQPQERKLGIDALRQFQHDWMGNTRSALTTYCHTLLNSAAFCYVD
ncbi:MAG: DUF1553 domain-containing protein, partial [Planctomycetales bacterium]|nr:DUF1553 domain-containing protein [Planctomycetales bacterium]